MIGFPCNPFSDGRVWLDGPALAVAVALSLPLRVKKRTMTRNEALKHLADRADALRALGATALFLFGSTAREEALLTSDLDLFIDYDQNRKFSLVDLVGIKQYLEDELGVEVDLTTRDSLHKVLRDDIERSAIRVF